MNTEPLTILPKKTRPPISAETLKLEDYMLTEHAKEPYRLITYQELDQFLGRKWPSYSGHLRSARNRLHTNQKLIFDSVHGKGIRLATAKEIIDGESARPDHVRRSMERGLKRLECVDPNALTAAERQKKSWEWSTYGTLLLFTSREGQKKLSEAVINQGKGRELHTDATLKLFFKD